jgi:hypothetical protein
MCFVVCDDYKVFWMGSVTDTYSVCLVVYVVEEYPLQTTQRKSDYVGDHLCPVRHAHGHCSLVVSSNVSSLVFLTLLRVRPKSDSGGSRFKSRLVCFFFS